MALIQSFEKSGNVLFRYRGQIPVLIFLLAIPIIFFTNQTLYQVLFQGGAAGLKIIVTVVALVVTLLGLVLRAYTVSTTPKGTSGRNTSKQVANQLNTKGIYSIVRHPLYLANYLIWAGVLIFTLNIYAFIIVSLVYWIYYERIMFAEEAFLRQQFGQSFENWSVRVPAFIPKFSLFERGDMQFSCKTFIRREYATFFSTVFSYVVADYLLMLAVMQANQVACEEIEWIRPSLYVLGIAVIITLIIKFIKHKTSLLKSEKNRD